MGAQFDYVILDESQAIKNPSSKVTKAACLLNAKHRLCMSGTPLQNNTFDIFAQMNFLNPGMLGTMEFFRQEFAMPIDKFGEPERKEHLKKILYPFILRRTKEQVARDLPEKQEMILFCEMEDEQRKIYMEKGGFPGLDMEYTVFGEVLSGMDVVEKISKLEKDANDRPLKDVKMKIKMI